MDTKLYKKLEICDAEKCWHHLRDVVVVQLMGQHVFPVPFLREASHFDIGHVVLKSRRSNMQKLTGIRSVCLPVGQLSQFVSVDPGKDLMQRLGNARKDQELKLNQAYEFHESDVRYGVKKTVTIQLWGCEKWAMEYVPKSGDMHVDLKQKGYIDVDRIFLITEVFYASQVKIYVAVGDEEDHFLLQGQIPVGFSMVRYKLEPDGTLGSFKRVKAGKWHGKWTHDPNGPLSFQTSEFHGKQSPI